MYEEFFHLHKRPFATTPDANCCYFADSVTEAHAALLHCVEAGQGMGILTGAPGAGKTLLCRKLASDLSGRFKTALIATGNLPTRRALIQGILYELAHPYSGMGEQELRLELVSTAKACRAEYEGILLILDEAHLLSERLLEEVRIISDFSLDGVPLVRVVISGQLQLEEKLTSSTLAAFNQRIASQVSLEPFTRQQTFDYIEYRCNWAGASSANIFTADALGLIARASDGIPRCINQLCDHSLLLAFIADSAQVDSQIVEQALEDLQQLPLHWNRAVAEIGSRVTPSNNSEPFRISGAADIYAAIESSHPPEISGAGPELPGACASFEIGAEPGSVDSVDIESKLQVSQPAAKSGVGSPKFADETFVDFDLFSSGRTVSSSARRPDFFGPAEELVLDRYAILDSGRILSGDFTSTIRSLPISEEFADTDGARNGTSHSVVDVDCGEHPADDSSAENVWQNTSGTPDHTLDRVQSLLEAADDNMENLPNWHEPLSVSSTLKTDASAQLGASGIVGAGNLESIEEQIGSLVLDVCLETQEKILNHANDVRAAGIVPLEQGLRLRHSLDGIPRVTRFDIVEPESVAASPSPAPEDNNVSSKSSTAPSGAVPRPNYKLIFSTLRRRQNQKGRI